MALKLKKEVKKSSYYVWFLGAKECKGLRGSDYIQPIISSLETRERTLDPLKMTLQVSHKGLKIIQNSSTNVGKKWRSSNETSKQFIPHNAITCVHQKEDVIAYIVLMSNPCPLQVHVYRCDSLETATLLRSQLQILIERPENQKKFAEIESKLMVRRKIESSIGSDTNISSTRESESSEERLAVSSSLYDSLAAELRAKLNRHDAPILLPPRDYDTVHRQKGNLSGIDSRRCLNASIVGLNSIYTKSKKLGSSGNSSGIGSDHAPSPDSPQDCHSTSDLDDWNADQDTNLYMLEPPTKPLVKSDKVLMRHKRINEKTFEFDEIKVSPRERFQDAKEKFKLLEKRNSNPIGKYIPESPIAPICKDRNPYRYFEMESQYHQKPSKCDVKRRSMFNLPASVEKEKHLEQKRQSLYQQPNFEEAQMKYIKNFTNRMNFRNSYAEPTKVVHPRKFEVLQRTNSSVSSNGRVGIASVHPY